MLWFFMAQVAAHRCSLGQVDGLATTAFIVVVIFIVPQVITLHRGLGKHGAFQVETMAATAGIRIFLVEILVLQCSTPGC